MGSIFSGNFGRRGKKRYLDELQRVHLPRIVGLNEGDVSKSCAVVILRHKDVHHPITLTLAKGGCFKAVTRFICPACKRRCTVLYIAQTLSCYRCAGTYRCQSESPARRSERRAMKILNSAEFDDNRPDGKIAWRRWKTHKQLLSKVRRAAGVLCERHDNVIYNLRQIQEGNIGREP